MSSKVKTLPLSLAIYAAAASAAIAAVPTSVQPGQVEKRFERDKNTSAPSRIQAPAVQDSGLTKQQRDSLSQQRFTLKSVSVEGATAYSQDTLKTHYADMIGKPISMLDAREIAKKITEHYRSDGYILSQAMVSGQNGGALKIRVVEGFIGNVVIEGDARDSYRNLLQHYGQNLTAKRPVSLTDMERYMLLMDDLPGATARGVVRPSKTQAGSADLIITMSHKPFEASYTMDNRGSKYIGPVQHTAIVSANSLFNMYDRTTLRFITTSPTTELRFFDLQHEQQVGSEGTRLVFIGSYSDSAPGDSLKSQFIRSDSTFFQIKATHPFSRSRQENLNGRLMFDTRDSQTDTLGTPSSKDRLRVVRAGGAYDFVDQFSGVDLIDFEISQGLDIFNASDNSGVQPSRTDGESDFTKLNLDLARTQSLWSDFSLYTSASGQYSFSRLMAAEQFSIGGTGFGQAYDPSELTGDHGVAGKVELRYGQTLGDPFLDSYQVYGFYDIGRVWFRDATPGTNDKLSLASAGLGIRTNFSDFLSGELQVAKPLTREVSNQGADDGKHPRMFFSVTGRF